jgi:protein involved in polysaccharide export with SLBB domain
VAAEGAVADSAAPAPEERTVAAPRERPETTPAGPLPFGYSLFESSPESYRQPTLGPVDPGYPLGPGDTIVLDVWGDTVFRVERGIDREGGISLPDVGRVVLAGMTLREARGALRRRLGQVYSGLSEDDREATTHLAVTLGSLRVVRVFVVGRARRPGGYDLSAASTVFHALFYAGGPTREGSLREIRLVRGGKEVATLDVYEFLRTGRRTGDVRLETDDTIFIPPAGPRVTVHGEVRTPGVYEMRAGETLADLVETSGGLTERAFEGRIQIERILTPEEREGSRDDRKVFDRAWEEAAETSLRDGDAVRVFPIADRMRNFVTIAGEVRRPGTYELREGETLVDLIAEAGGALETAFLDRADLVRTRDDLTKEQLAVDVGRALAGEREHDLPLEPRDTLTVYSIWRLQDRHEVSVRGAVRSPGTYELRERMTLRDLLLQAGGLQESAWPDEVEISRVRPKAGDSPETAEVFKLPLGEGYLSREGDDVFLQPYDNVFVRWIPNYELQRNVTVAGEVRFPGTYTLRSPVERLSEVIARTGGLKVTAFPAGFALYRRKDDLGRVALDLERALRHPGSQDDVILFAGDSLFVPEEPKTVTVRGEVGFPTSLVYERGMSIGDYVARAGGTTEGADSRQIRIVYSTGAAARVKRFWFDPPVQPGSTIHVPRKEQRDGVAWGTVLRDSASILASLATVALVADKIGD